MSLQARRFVMIVERAPKPFASPHRAGGGALNGRPLPTSLRYFR